MFVQERERGRFNQARDGASREPRQNTGGAPGEYARAMAERQGALALIPIRRSQFGLRGPLWASVAVANYTPPNTI
jgi:hypothetical protein